MADHRRAFAGAPVHYHPYVEPAPGAGKGLLAALAARAAVVVTDQSPAFFYPRLLAAAAAQVPCRLEAVDGVGLLPLRAADGRVFPSAHAFRRHLQRTLPEHLHAWPAPAPLAALDLPAPVLPSFLPERWPAPDPALLAGDPAALARLPIDHRVAPAPLPGGPDAGARALAEFLARRLPRYAEGRNDLDDGAASGLSPYLHFGHVGAHQIVRALLDRARWSPDRLGRVTGSREGWWGLDPAAEAFLDELITWRELGHHLAHHRPASERHESLPEWARQTLAAHAADPRERLYTLADFERARTHDPLWNAAQRQLLVEGTIHNYLRMLWGKKILEWSPTPQDALAVMIELNNKYALDGRDPNSYSGIFWVLGRYDRPWGPERPVIGLLRPMSSQNTARKLRTRGYLARHGDAPPLL